MNSLLVAATAAIAVAVLTRTTAPLGIKLFICVAAIIIVGVEVMSYGDDDYGSD